MIDPKLQALYQILEKYLKAVPLQMEPGAPDLLEIFQQLDAEERQVAAFASAELRHYLHNKSYRKAYQYLQGKTPEGHAPKCATKGLTA